MSDASQAIGVGLALWLAFTLGGAAGDCTGVERGRDAMCRATCADAADWRRDGDECVCLDPTPERPARRSRHADR